MSFREIPLRFLLLKSESNLEQFTSWLEYVAGPQFIQNWKTYSQTKGNLAEMVQLARDVVEEDIYAYNTTEGTGNIKDSMQAGYLETEMPSWAVSSNPSVAPSKGPFSSGDPSSFSYAAFFEDPRFNTFIPPADDPLNPKRYRPFFDDMTQRQRKLSRDIVLRSLIRALQRRMPRILS